MSQNQVTYQVTKRKHLKWVLQMEISVLLPEAVFQNTGTSACSESCSTFRSPNCNRDLMDKTLFWEGWAEVSSLQQKPPSKLANFSSSLRKLIFNSAFICRAWILTVEFLKWAKTQEHAECGWGKEGTLTNRSPHQRTWGRSPSEEQAVAPLLRPSTS